MSPDPIGLAGGETGYSAYAGSNPLVFSDPDGLLAGPPYARGCVGRSCGGPGARTPKKQTKQGLKCDVFCEGYIKDRYIICQVEIRIERELWRATRQTRVCALVEEYDRAYVTSRTDGALGFGRVYNPTTGVTTEEVCHVKSDMVCRCAETSAGTCRSGSWAE